MALVDSLPSVLSEAMSTLDALLDYNARWKLKPCILILPTLVFEMCGIDDIVRMIVCSTL